MEPQPTTIILDTDFISKANNIQTDSNHVLADLILGIPNCIFCCHEMVIKELSCEKTTFALSWMQSKIASGLIACYSDKIILDILKEKIGDSCYKYYTGILKASCNFFEDDCFENEYNILEQFADNTVSENLFLDELSFCDANIGSQHSLGEKKSFVLLQTLETVSDKRNFMFFSDDLNARNNLNNHKSVQCVGITGIFVILKNNGISKEMAAAYFWSYAEFCVLHGQTKLHVWEFHGSFRRIKQDFSVVFDGIYENKYALMLNGELLVCNTFN